MQRRTVLALLIACLAVVVAWFGLRTSAWDAGPPIDRADSASEHEEAAPEPHGDSSPSLVGAADAEASVTEPGTVRNVEVRVLGRDGKGLPEFPLVVIGPKGEVAHVAFTDGEGNATFTELPLDGSHSVATLAFQEKFGLQVTEPVPIRRTEIVLRSDLGLPCEVVVTDAETGRALPGVPWSLYPRDAFVDGIALPLRVGKRTVLAEPGRDLGLQLRVAVPEGYVAWANDDPYVEISHHTTALRYVYPLHREADVQIDVLEHDGAPARDPLIVMWSLAGKEGQPGSAVAESLALNRLKLRGVPYLAGAMLRVWVGLDDAEDHRVVQVSGRLAHPTRLVARLPTDSEPTDGPFQMPGESMIGLGGSGDDPPLPEPPPGALVLSARLRDGAAASDVHVAFRYLEEGYALRGFRAALDARGQLAQELPAGRWKVSIHEPGLVQTEETFEVRAGKTTTVRLHEGQGGTVRLRIVDSAGRPLPFARFQINDWMWRDLENGLQRIDPYVDHQGARTLHHVSPGLDWRVLAWYADGRGTTTISVREGETTTVTVIVKPKD